jgi:hypothetical protein
MFWYYRIGRKVWFYEIWSFLYRDHLQKKGPSLEEFWGEPQDGEQYAMGRHYKMDSYTGSSHNWPPAGEIQPAEPFVPGFGMDSHQKWVEFAILNRAFQPVHECAHKHSDDHGSPG